MSRIDIDTTRRLWLVPEEPAHYSYKHGRNANLHSYPLHPFTSTFPSFSPPPSLPTRSTHTTPNKPRPPRTCRRPWMAPNTTHCLVNVVSGEQTSSLHSLTAQRIMRRARQRRSALIPSPHAHYTT